MATSLRKQREFHSRQESILEVASKLLQEFGYRGFSMDRIATHMDYAKGTIYQHFACKEEVLAALSIRCMTELAELFECAVACRDTTRQQILSIALAYDCYITKWPERFKNIQMIKSAAVRDKLGPTMRAALLEHETSLMHQVAQVVRRAVTQGELERGELSPEELVFGLWSQANGGMLLCSCDLPLEQMGITKTGVTLHRFMEATLDGLAWSPIGHRIDYHCGIKRILKLPYFSSNHKRAR